MAEPCSCVGSAIQKRKALRMEPAGWAAVVLGACTGVVLVLHYLLDQVQALCLKFVKVVEAIREAKAAIKKNSESN